MTGVQTCALPIYIRKYYKELKRDLEDRKNKRPVDSANVIVEQSDDGTDNGLLLTSVADSCDGDILAASIGNNSLNDWILDSGCSYHVTPNRSWFDTYTSSQGTIVLGDDYSVDVKGIGTIKVKMFDGIVRTFTDVRYVPEQIGRAHV